MGIATTTRTNHSRNLREFVSGEIGYINNRVMIIGPSWNYEEVLVPDPNAREIIDWYIDTSKHKFETALADGYFMCLSKTRNFSYFLLRKSGKWYKLIVRKKIEYLKDDEDSDNDRSTEKTNGSSD